MKSQNIVLSFVFLLLLIGGGWYGYEQYQKGETANKITSIKNNIQLGVLVSHRSLDEGQADKYQVSYVLDHTKEGVILVHPKGVYHDPKEVTGRFDHFLKDQMRLRDQKHLMAIRESDKFGNQLVKKAISHEEFKKLEIIGYVHPVATQPFWQGEIELLGDRFARSYEEGLKKKAEAEKAKPAETK